MLRDSETRTESSICCCNYKIMINADGGIFHRGKFQLFKNLVVLKEHFGWIKEIGLRFRSFVPRKFYF